MPPSNPLETSRRRPWTRGGVLLALVLGMTACAAGSSASHAAADGGLVSQFLLGIWHGIIAPATLLVEVIHRLDPHLLPWTARFYEAAGARVEYDVGFYLGLTGSPLIAWSRLSGYRGASTARDGV